MIIYSPGAAAVMLTNRALLQLVLEHSVLAGEKHRCVVLSL